jgi:iron complex outermembrane recepter protein
MKKILFLIIIIGISEFLHSDVLTGNIRGTVVDENSKPLEMVSVMIQEMGISTITNENGVYNFFNIPYGMFNLTFSKTGYVTKTRLFTLNDSLNNYNIKLEQSLIETATIDVSSSFEAQDISQSTFSTSTLNSRNLIKERGEILGATISNIPGVNQITTGIGIGKPVIRGLSSNSVLIIHDGVKQESQQWGDEHAPEISLYDIEKIDILRGPASLVYGSEGIGGVVNIISKPLQYSNLNKILTYGNIDMGFFSVNNEGTGNITLGTGLKNIGFKGHFGYRKSGNVKTPEGTFLINSLNGTSKDTINGGILTNSGTKEYEGGLSLGLKGNFGYIDAGFEIFNREIKMHDPNPLSTGNQLLNTNQFEISGNFNLSKKFHLEPILSYQMHDRKEYESTEARNNDISMLYWKLRSFQGDIRLHNDLNANLSGTIGIMISNEQNNSLGIEKLIPGYNSTSYGIYALEKYNISKFTFSAGIRYDIKKLTIRSTIFETDTLGNPSKILNPQDVDFSAFSGSAGIVFRPNKNVDIFTNLGRGWRAPSEFELFVDGVHEGTNRVEKGIMTLNPNATPNPETSLNIDLGVRTRLGAFYAEISVFNNILNNFIYPSPTNLIDSASGLRIFNIVQDKSTFRGIEYSFQFQPLDFILLSLNGDYLFTNNNATDSPLPFTPPSKNIIEIKLQKNSFWKLYNPYFSFKTKIESPQNNVDPMETKTDGYTLFYAGVGFDYILTKSVMSVDFSVDNLLDTKYVDHLSRYKSYAMNPGRSINMKVSVPFQF